VSPPLKDPRGFPLDADPPGASFFIIIFVQLTRESKYKAEDEGPAASGALGLIALSSIEVEKGKQKTLKNSGKRRKKEKSLFQLLGGKRIWLAGSSSSSATACFVWLLAPPFGRRELHPFLSRTITHNPLPPAL
jgi:hypothetical protein